jgi:hypothetical protein
MAEPLVVWWICGASAALTLLQGASLSVAFLVLCGSASSIIAARRLRGRTHLQDGLIPLGWLLACSEPSARLQLMAGFAIAVWAIVAAWRAGRTRASARAT